MLSFLYYGRSKTKTHQIKEKQTSDAHFYESTGFDFLPEMRKTGLASHGLF